MFVQAIETAKKYTRAVIVSTLNWDNEVKAGCGTFIVVNDEGWVVTAAHILNEQQIFNQHSSEIAEYERQKNAILADNSLTIKQKNKKINKLQVNRQWLKKVSYWWGKDNVTLTNVSIDPLADIAIGKLEPFNNYNINTYPSFKNINENMIQGTSLCKLGFPFHNITSTYDETVGAFRIAEGVLPMPIFPLEGMLTRIAMVIAQDTNRQAKFIETSTPGLRGQSGGPTFDVNGNIWAIQSKTAHFELGFSPVSKQGNKQIVENQFLNVGLGSHIENVINLLQRNGVNFNLV